MQLESNNGVKTLLWIKKMARDFNIPMQNLTVFKDSKSTIYLARNEFKNSKRTRHIDIKYYEQIDNQILHLEYLPTSIIWTIVQVFQIEFFCSRF